MKGQLYELLVKAQCSSSEMICDLTSSPEWFCSTLPVDVVMVQYYLPDSDYFWVDPASLHRLMDLFRLWV